MKKRWIIIALVLVVVAGVGIALAQKFSPNSTEKSAPMTASLQSLLDEAAKAEAEADRVALKNALTKIMNDHPDFDKADEIQQKLGQLNIDLILSNEATPQSEMYEVQVGDSLGKLAKKYGTTKELIKRSNRLRSDVIRVGQKLRIWKAPFNIFVDKSQNVLVLKSGNEIIKTYRCSTGKDNITPVGTFTIANKIEKPVWFKSGASPVPAESPDNELGTRWMGFGEDPHYGIHGTIRPDQIGTQATAGCVRLRNEEVEELFDIVPAGTKVIIQD